MSYCGSLRIPKGKQRGTPEECLLKKQIRYYGIEKIDPKILENRKKRKPKTEIEELLLLNRLTTEAKVLLSKIKNAKVVLELVDNTPSEKKRIQKQLDSFLKKRDKLVKELKEQRKIVDSLKK